MLNLDEKEGSLDTLEVKALNYEKFLRESMKILDCLCLTDYYGSQIEGITKKGSVYLSAHILGVLPYRNIIIG